MAWPRQSKNLALEARHQQTKRKLMKGSGGGLVVSVLAFYSNHPSSIPTLVT